MGKKKISWRKFKNSLDSLSSEEQVPFLEDLLEKHKKKEISLSYRARIFAEEFLRGYEEGFEKGFKKGHNKGFEDGLEDGLKST